MSIIQLGDHCCQAGDKQLNTRAFRNDELILTQDENPELVFCPLGHAPNRPKLALVGVTPGGQEKNFAEHLRRTNVEVAARKAAFNGKRSVILELLGAHGLAEALGIDTGDESIVFEGEQILTTSLARCCLRSSGAYKYKAPDLIATERAQHCIHTRFRPLIESRSATLTHAVFFGEPSWAAAGAPMHGGQTLLAWLGSLDIVPLRLPHFSQNFQQRAIYPLKRSDHAKHFETHPDHENYRPTAWAMAAETIAEVQRLRANATKHQT